MDAQAGAATRASPGVIWSGAAYACRFGAQLLVVLLLSRVLSPSDFGLMAMATIIAGLALVVRDLGTGPAVVRSEDLTDSFLASQFVVALLAGLVLGLLVAASGPIAAAVFGEPEVQVLLAVLSVGFVIGGVGVVPQALLERRLQFRAIALAEAVAGTVAIPAALGAAVAGWGAMSLAVFTVLQTGVGVVVIVIAARWSPRGRPSRSDVKLGLRFGVPLTGFSVLNYLVRNADNALIGVVLGPALLGFYAVAYRMILFPVQIVTSVGNRVLLPVLSRLAASHDEMRSTYLTAVAMTSLLALPVAAGIAAAADAIVAVLLGPGWEPTVPVVRLLAVVACVQVVGATVGPIFLATGRTDRLFMWGVASAFVTLAAFLAGLPYGIVGVAAAYAAASTLLFLPSLSVSLRLIGLPVAEVIRRIAPHVIAALAGAMASLAVSRFIPSSTAVIALVLELIALAVVYAIVVRALDPRTVRVLGGAVRGLRLA